MCVGVGYVRQPWISHGCSRRWVKSIVVSKYQLNQVSPDGKSTVSCALSLIALRLISNRSSNDRSYRVIQLYWKIDLPIYGSDSMICGNVQFESWPAHAWFWGKWPNDDHCNPLLAMCATGSLDTFMSLSKVLMDACIRMDKSQCHHWLRPISMTKVMMDACIRLRIKVNSTIGCAPSLQH